MQTKRKYVNKKYGGIIFPDHGFLTKDEMYELVKTYRDESLPENKRIAARNLVASLNQKLIIKFVQKYHASHRDKNIHDLWEAAIEGFMLAFDKADVDRLKYINFSTYASWWMKAFLGDVNKHSGTIRYSASFHKQMDDDHKEIKRKMKTATPREIHNMWAEFSHKWSAMKSNMGNMPSFDQPIGDGKSTIADGISGNDDTMTVTGKRLLLNVLRNVIINSLDDEERHVVKAIYGIDGERQNFRQLAETLNMSSDAAKKIRNAALSKLRTDKDFKKTIASLNIMTSVNKGSNVCALFNNTML